ncbi:antA/AntB antirepressor family protein [Salmonella enterica subsp. diarizonae]|uniref:antA/AntB antirepressor family protein n=1 Tax=Salmonella enterica TaxID=28901 RepID=UPI000B7BD45E|nr:antA/AntB antirepressor family protein [Salmonella enterica]EAA2772468.1 antA/AntB antirepressor family protein [Salmonella enterica subsp. diarizonae]ASO09256.1 antA/AntB antirepressor family protein [Salmonella enterica subsp. salamae serovar 57:z29:z42]ECZ0253015.1 antA/AntB antirepressor family protein [Salmonella enterica subsp. diarizonae]EDQ5531219.1 antA/AntB antirepressor family protein [Salmonella enterica subsp. diarizonae]EHA0597726.1 antA/AntB antirepressor family protein [Salm
MKQKNNPIQGRGLLHPEQSQNVNFAEIIPVISGVIGGSETNIVSARALHKALGVKRDFTNWIKGRIEEYGFKKGVDFELVEYLTSPNPASAKSRQQLAHDYLLTVNMAKELAMVERTEQGRAVRLYFIRCEEELHKAAPEKAAALRRELKARITVASYFKPMCASLDLLRAEQGKTTQPYHYTTEANMLARIVLGGMTARQWAQANGITGEPRDHMSTLQLEHLSYLEQSNITLIETGQDYRQRKAELIRLSQRWLARRMEENSHV